MNTVESQQSTATLPPGCLLFMLPKCLKTDGEGNGETQTAQHSDSVSSLKAYIIYRSCTSTASSWVHESQSGSMYLSGWKQQTVLMWSIFCSWAWNMFDNSIIMGRLTLICNIKYVHYETYLDFCILKQLHWVIRLPSIYSSYYFLFFFWKTNALCPLYSVYTTVIPVWLHTPIINHLNNYE